MRDRTGDFAGQIICAVVIRAVIHAVIELAKLFDAETSRTEA